MLITKHHLLNFLSCNTVCFRCNKYGDFAPVEDYFGLVKCSVLPPRALYHPVLSYRTQGKLMFPLCRTCADTLQQTPCQHGDRERTLHGTWVNLELEKALEKGYSRSFKLRKYGTFHNTQTGSSRTILIRSLKSSKRYGFKQWVATVNSLLLLLSIFLHSFLQASGFPDGCVTDQQKADYIADYAAKEGTQLDPRQIMKNPGLRALAKLMLNSFWGIECYTVITNAFFL